MKNKLKIALLAFVAVSTSCQEDLDINTDPNFPQEINKGLALAASEASLATVVGGDLTNLGGFYAQYHTQAPTASQYENIDAYNINITYADRLWTELYAGCLNDLKYVLDTSNAAGDTGTALIATVLQAYTYQLLVDLFGDVPYSQALGGLQNITPAADPGEEIYMDLLARISAAQAAYAANPVPSDVGGQDIIYGADMDNWNRFANTLKLRIYLRMAYTPMANPAAVNALIAENNFIDEDAAFDNFGTSLNQTNPFFGVQLSNEGSGLGDVNNVASNSLHEFYVLNNDPRLEFVYRPNTAGNYISIPQGSGDEFNNTAVNYSRPNVQRQTPVFLITVAESNFLQAEALIRYAGGAGAQQKYEEGVRASFATYQANFFDSEGETFLSANEALQAANDLLAGPYAYTPGGTVEEQVRQVIVQKWAALAYVNNIEAWIETTRTKYPEIVPEGTENYAEGNRIPSRISVLSGTTVPSILFYPDYEVNRNPNIQQRNNITENVWWDQKPE
ncbi:SusD/RagB family nutrient-binding outer membrane lipoprotein [Flavobacterium cyanobacteriorum]|uniref:SusD/RagB family nutrient-binding outer membrane lipoprotein n=1 Tax=Flavobacterium cyanobacteriorum TaxID=2022802 RepID=A0A255ZBB2_9FLAO|nr:SusD/RagB family nutrient-binding outer membrane lipoprotein [Flavobacterium cyanobacteriorum]OYQ38194.1 SusD/RagB family nutrient-binding outer membrane lipoprotein [Flavobacterium cyanobacteriorum]